MKPFFFLLILTFTPAAQAREQSLFGAIEPEIPRYRTHLTSQVQNYFSYWIGRYYKGQPAAEESAPAAPRPALPEDPKISFAYASDRTVDFNGMQFGRCLAQVTAHDFPKFQFNKNNMKCLREIEGVDYQYQRADKPSLMDYLAAQHRKCDYSSGHERTLHRWVMEQPDNSVDPLKLYREALRLNNGNIWNALITVHQIVRREARFFDAGRYNYRSTPEAATAFFNKLVDIRGDLRERGEKYYGDHPGTWYRIWGAMLFRLLPFDEADFLLGTDAEVGGCKDELGAGHSSLKLLADNVTAMMVFVGDEAILKMNGETDKRGKIKADLEAAISVAPMFQRLSSPEWLADRPEEEFTRCLQAGYLTKRKR